MALVTCIDCQKSHSDQAQACPNCGRPTAASKPVLIEQTAKRWKDRQTIAVLIILFSLMLMFTALYAWGCIIAVAGLIMLIHARYQTWYHHR